MAKQNIFLVLSPTLIPFDDPYQRNIMGIFSELLILAYFVSRSKYFRS